MAIQKPKLSRLISRQLPEFIREDYPTFVAFLEAYYEWLSTQDADLYQLRDLDKTLDSFIEYFRNELAPNSLTPTSTTDQRFLLQNIKDQHLAKGSEASYKLLFRLLFNKNVTIDYPGKQILRASDGKWNQDVSIFARINAGTPDTIVGRLVDIVTPNRVIRVLVDRRQDVEVEVDRVVQISPDTYEFYIDRRFFGNISINDRMRYEGIFDATIVATTSKLSILQKGKNFKVGQLYPIKNGDGSGSVVKIKTVDTQGGILAAEFVKYGIGYETDFTATLLAQGGQTTTGAGQAALSVARTENTVTSIQITNGGSGYTTTPTVALSGGGFTSAATVGAVTVVGGVITSIRVATPGSGYTEPPTVIITGGGGTGAAAIATVGDTNAYGIFETTEGFNEQGYINLADYTQDVANIWRPRTAYSVGDQIYFNKILYDVTVAGTTGDIPPSHDSGSASNGTVTLEYNRIHGPAWEGTYSGDTIREFFYDGSAEVVDPDAPAIIKIELGPLTKYPGYFKNNDGFLDDAIFIQDSRYYQSYAYLVKIDEKLESYKSAVKTLIHPSGMALFGEYDIRNSFDISINLESMVKILVVNAQDEVLMTSQITRKDFGKSLEDSFGFTDSHTFLLQKPLSDDFTPTDGTATKLFSKALTDSTSGFSETVTRQFGKSLSDSTAPTDEITAKVVSKSLADDFSTSETVVFELNKYISESTPIADSGGELWLNPYDNPYPASNAYFANDSGNYTTGESAFTG